MTPWRFGEPIEGWLCPDSQCKLAELIQKWHIHTVLEIGTCYGASALWFAARVNHVTCIDLWQDIPEHGFTHIFPSFIANVRASGLASKLTALVGNSHFLTLGDARFDLVYIDAGHTYEDVRQDIEMYGPMADKVLCGDDYDVNLPSVAGVVRAVDECVPERRTFGRFWYWERK